MNCWMRSKKSWVSPPARSTGLSVPVKNFKGVYDRDTKKITCILRHCRRVPKKVEDQELPVDDARTVHDPGSEQIQKQLLDEIELLDGASAEFDQELVSKGELSPVFFGSALTNFGVETFLKHFLKMTTSPLPRKADVGWLIRWKKNFLRLYFKIQANMNKAHRDRIAFMRICSGKFEAGMEVLPCAGRQEDPSVPAAADDGAGS